LVDAPGPLLRGVGLRRRRGAERGLRARAPHRDRGRARVDARAARPRRAHAVRPHSDRGARRLTALRDAYPVLERVAYLNAGTFGPFARVTLSRRAARQ